MSKNLLFGALFGVCLAGQLMSMDKHENTKKNKQHRCLRFALEFYSYSDPISCDLIIRKVSAHNMAVGNVDNLVGKDFCDVGPIPIQDNSNFVLACYHAMDYKQIVKAPYTLNQTAYLYALVQQKKYELKITPSSRGWDGDVQLYVTARTQRKNDKYTPTAISYQSDPSKYAQVFVKNVKSKE